ncbi:sugar O-acetyltransferase [Acetobacter lambici]|uniref:sugar O-acetyltransferase n=1 Tax=Acetobacter lambici TaxID=1332824 RepID=UPI00140A2E5F|nr:sugar O-acetyltransferase [Acetobacter lambici]NHO57844.1 sugar O-acetyltransferase [Acetobacter lambici]
MTLAERMAFIRTGAMYNDLAPELVRARADAVVLSNRYNASSGRPQAEREGVLRTLLGGIGQQVHFEPALRCEFGCNITIGNNFYANFDCILLDAAPITIGDNVLFGPRVGLYSANHALDAQERAAGGCYARPITIGQDVWLGAGVHVTPGVHIGAGSIIGAGSVVTRDVPAGVVAAGVPCRVLRALTPADRTGFVP